MALTQEYNQQSGEEAQKSTPHVEHQNSTFVGFALAMRTKVFLRHTCGNATARVSRLLAPVGKQKTSF
eukprot:646440-Amphidinium_carterae.1